MATGPTRQQAFGGRRQSIADSRSPAVDSPRQPTTDTRAKKHTRVQELIWRYAQPRKRLAARNFTEKPQIRLMNSHENSLQVFFREIQCRAKPASVSAGCGGDATHRKGRRMAVAMLAWAGAIPYPKAANGGPPRQRLPWSRASAPLPLAYKALFIHMNAPAHRAVALF